MFDTLKIRQLYFQWYQKRFLRLIYKLKNFPVKTLSIMMRGFQSCYFRLYSSKSKIKKCGKREVWPNSCPHC